MSNVITLSKAILQRLFGKKKLETRIDDETGKGYIKYDKVMIHYKGSGTIKIEVLYDGFELASYNHIGMNTDMVTIPLHGELEVSFE